MLKQNKGSLIALLIVLVVTVVLSLLTLTISDKEEVVTASLSKDARAEFYYDYEEIYFNTNVSDEHSAQFATMIDRKVLLPASDVDNAIFNEKIYLSFEDKGEVKIFYIAVDGSGKLKHNDMYLSLTKEESAELYELLSFYSAKFPCV